MIGMTEFPPYWSLGFHLSRYGYQSTDDIRALRQRMLEDGIPQVKYIAIIVDNFVLKSGVSKNVAKAKSKL